MFDNQFFFKKKVLITGNTGFKGSWLSIWLHLLGAKIYGLALKPPTKPSLFEEAGLDNEDVIKKIGHKFKETVLALGGSLTPAEVFKLFRGRAPKSQALLKAYGLLEKGA